MLRRALEKLLALALLVVGIVVGVILFSTFLLHVGLLLIVSIAVVRDWREGRRRREQLKRSLIETYRPERGLDLFKRLQQPSPGRSVWQEPGGAGTQDWGGGA